MDDSRFSSIKDGDIEVQYFSCPSCGAKYLFFASDSKMRDLVRQRKALQLKIRAGHAKKFKERTLEKYMREYEEIKKEQEKMMPGLKALGEKILRGEDS